MKPIGNNILCCDASQSINPGPGEFNVTDINGIVKCSGQEDGLHSINYYETKAIMIALNWIEYNDGGQYDIIYTDSQTALAWITKGKCKLTPAQIKVYVAEIDSIQVGIFIGTWDGAKHWQQNNHPGSVIKHDTSSPTQKLAIDKIEESKINSMITFIREKMLYLSVDIAKWKTKEWGEIPADYGRKIS